MARSAELQAGGMREAERGGPSVTGVRLGASASSSEVSSTSHWRSSPLPHEPAMSTPRIMPVASPASLGAGGTRGRSLPWPAELPRATYSGAKRRASDPRALYAIEDDEIEILGDAIGHASERNVAVHHEARILHFTHEHIGDAAQTDCAARQR
jgi:hypothetical protein